MATILEIAKEYGVSKSTARRWVKKHVPDAFDSDSDVVELSESQMHVLASALEREGRTTVSSDDVDSEPVYEAPWSTPEAPNEALVAEIYELRIENAELRTELEGLNRSMKQRESDMNRSFEALVKRAEAAEKALEREQNISRGFWSRLGQKLLGNGGGKSEKNG